MAYYTWKKVRDQIPESFVESWCKEKGVESYDLYDCESYDWDYWSMVADYIKHLKGGGK